jgi:transposase InsO family protein
MPQERQACIWHLVCRETANSFLSLAEARATITAWHDAYNHSRPHSSLGTLTPNEWYRVHPTLSIGAAEIRHFRS